MRDALTLRVLDHLGEVDAPAWDRLVGEDDPFVEHAFLRGLELSGSVGEANTGWVPRHLVLFSGADLVAAMPLYEKHDSRGEYIFDWGWAHAAEQAGIPYFPKLVAAVPFTPVTGRRLLISPLLDRAQRANAGRTLLAGVRRVADEIDASSAHLLFVTEPEQQLAADHGFQTRANYQFHWANPGGWRNFDDYLGAMRSRARKQIRRERREAASHGLRIELRTGAELEASDWLALSELYRLNTADKWAIPYLTQDFFSYARTQLAHRVRVASASLGTEIYAAALFFHKGNGLFGRYWGARVPLRAMHFELCYYQPIAWCLEHGVTRFEAGAQGAHKLKRGLLPARCHSAHWLRHPALATAVERFLPHERVEVAKEMSFLADHGPYRTA